MRSISGKTALITGGASGIGLGMARAFARAGAKVALADVDEVALAAATEELRRAGGEALAVTLDTTDLAAWGEAAARVGAELGPIAVLCNNAGIGGTHEPVAESSPGRWARVIQVNFMGYYYGCLTCLPGMLARQEEGHVVNVSSLSGLRANPFGSAYSASKFAVVGMTDALRGELEGSKVGVSVVYPGVTATNLSANTIKLNGRPGGEPPGRAVITERLAKGMHPDRLGERVLQAVLAGEYHVFSHPEYKPEIEEAFSERLAAFPNVG
jgi:NAD(P)-dependent dehydrogenase (short-subunit alcohol dehydrogenase family)